MKTINAIAATFWLTLLTSIAIFFGVKIPLSRLDVPFTFAGDAVEKLMEIKTVAENGWLFHNVRLGFPFGYDRLDFPRFDSLNYAIMGPIAALTGSPGLSMNLYFIAGFYLIAFSAFYAFRRLGLSFSVATICALAYTVLPYHIFRGVSHLTNGTYFLVPLAMLTATLLAHGDIGPETLESRRRWLYALFVGILVPLQMPYNGVFFAFLVIVAACIGFAQRARWREIFVSVSIIAAIGGAFSAEQIPVWVHAAKEGSITVPRSPQDAEIYSMKLNQVLLPDAGHRIAAFRNLAHSFAGGMNLPNSEVRNQYIGLIGVGGLVALLWSLLRALRQKQDASVDNLERFVRISAVFALAMILLAISSGIGNLVAFFISDDIRAYNRILPFLAFACLLGGGWAIQLLLAKLSGGTRTASTLILGVVLVLDVMPQGMSHTPREKSIAQYDKTKEYFHQVEGYLGSGAKVFQLPVIWFPEHPPVNKMIDYAYFKPYLLTTSLIFSSGGGQFRPGYIWASQIAKKPYADQIAAIRSQGFDAVLIDGNAYVAGELNHMVAEFSKLIDPTPLVSPDKRWWAFTFKDTSERADTAGTKLEYTIGDPPIRFSSKDNHSLPGWYSPETWGTWAPTLGNIDIAVQPSPKSHIRLTIDTQMMLGPKTPVRQLEIECNNHPCGEFKYTLKNAVRTLNLTVPPDWITDGVISLRFLVTPEATPQSAGVNSDMRPLGIGLKQLSIEVQ